MLPTAPEHESAGFGDVVTVARPMPALAAAALTVKLADVPVMVPWVAVSVVVWAS